MAQFEEEDELIMEWLAPLTSMSVEEFCLRWVPIFYNLPVAPHTLPYRQACVHLIAIVTDNSKRTVQNWLSDPKRVPEQTQKYLQAIDQLWQIRCRMVGLPQKNSC